MQLLTSPPDPSKGLPLAMISPKSISAKSSSHLESFTPRELLLLEEELESGSSGSTIQLVTTQRQCVL